ncbi:trace amine-associated receptor 4 [Austrofundulus limnaeus]|uniref:Trace amine-associated receptor 4 n=1 Tax=Austrofundulus limnaeus TaxID=52670 RepID=A0A2I4D386_AUSLI|nr:PREDICTED: trace amine-associated receptor 4-like [Austrofundulus limnaeus]
MPLEILISSSCWLLGDIICVLSYCIMCQIISTSVGNIVFVSIDRYIAIGDPLHYATRITLAKVKCCICLCWLSAASCVLFYMKDELIQPGRSRSCFGECKVVTNYIMGTFDLIVNFICPVTVIIVLYMRVFVVVVSQARAMRSHTTAAALQKSGILKTKKSELKAARTLGVLVFVFLLCFCPYYCVFFAVSDEPDASSNVYTIFLFYLNSCLNPVIYTLFYPWFRKCIKLIVTLQILRPGSCETKIL